MRVFIADCNKTVTIRIYGVDGKERTKEFFSVFFHRAYEVYETTDEERKLSGTDGEFTIGTYALFKSLAGVIGSIQDAVDTVSYAMIDGREEDDFVINDEYYLI